MQRIVLLLSTCLLLALEATAISGPSRSRLPTTLQPIELATTPPAMSRPTTRKEIRLARQQVRQAARAERQDGLPDIKTTGFAVASLVCAIVGIFVGAVILGPLAVVFGAVALSRIKKSEGRIKGRGLGIAGIALGIVVTILGIIAVSIALRDL